MHPFTNFINSERIIKDANQKLIAIAMKVGSLYHMTCTKPKDHMYSVTTKSDCLYKEDLWYCQYDHLGAKSWLEVTWLRSLTTIPQMTFHSVSHV